MKPSTIKKKLLTYLLCVLILFFLVVVIRTAWMCDDAYITLRTVDNLVHGYGPRWNTYERVQSYTHPLWMILISMPYFFTREPYYTVIFLSIILTLSAVLLLAYKIAISNKHAIVAVLILLFSKPFVDFSTSGLENALSYLLFTIFLWIYLHYHLKPKKIFWMFIVGSLILLARQDYLLIILPILLSTIILIPKREFRTYLWTLAGLFPIILWEAFSLIYYGALVPNTTYAKIAVGIPHVLLLIQGWHYYTNTFIWSPLTMIVIIGALALSLKERKNIPIALGILLYLAFILFIGGDFMSGRFFTIPLLLSVIILCTSRYLERPRTAIAIGIIVVVLGFITPQPTILSGPSFDRTIFGTYKENHGIADERGHYYQALGLLREGDDIITNFDVYKRGLDIKNNPDIVYVQRSVGILGYYAGHEGKIIDRYGLCDALLARIPCNCSGEWRIGHFERIMPPGYGKSVYQQRNIINDTNMAEYYDAVKLVTQGKVFSVERFITIIKLNLGMYDHLIDREYYRGRKPTLGA